MEASINFMLQVKEPLVPNGLSVLMRINISDARTLSVLGNNTQAATAQYFFWRFTL
jgi:hypothetical protein